MQTAATLSNDTAVTPLRTAGALYRELSRVALWALHVFSMFAMFYGLAWFLADAGGANRPGDLIQVRQAYGLQWVAVAILSCVFSLTAGKALQTLRSL